MSKTASCQRGLQVALRILKSGNALTAVTPYANQIHLPSKTDTLSIPTQYFLGKEMVKMHHSPYKYNHNIVEIF